MDSHTSTSVLIKMREYTSDAHSGLAALLEKLPHISGANSVLLQEWQRSVLTLQAAAREETTLAENLVKSCDYGQPEHIYRIALALEDHLVRTESQLTRFSASVKKQGALGNHDMEEILGDLVTTTTALRELSRATSSLTQGAIAASTSSDFSVSSPQGFSPKKRFMGEKLSSLNRPVPGPVSDSPSRDVVLGTFPPPPSPTTSPTSPPPGTSPGKKDTDSSPAPKRNIIWASGEEMGFGPLF